MKKLLSILVLTLLTSNICLAEDMKVMALNDFSTDKPCEIKVKVLETMSLDSNIIIEEGSIVTGKMVNIVPAKRLKRDATFSFMPTSYITPDYQTYHINNEYIGKFSPHIEIDKKKLATSAALTVGNHLLTGFSAGYRAIEGAIKDEKDNRLISSVNNVYENSFLSYVEKGGATCIKAESLFTFKFKNFDKKGTEYSEFCHGELVE